MVAIGQDLKSLNERLEKLESIMAVKGSRN